MMRRYSKIYDHHQYQRSTQNLLRIQYSFPSDSNPRHNSIIVMCTQFLFKTQIYFFLVTSRNLAEIDNFLLSHSTTSEHAVGEPCNKQPVSYFYINEPEENIEILIFHVSPCFLNFPFSPNSPSCNAIAFT